MEKLPIHSSKGDAKLPPEEKRCENQDIESEFELVDPQLAFHSRGTYVEWRTALPPKDDFFESPVFTLCGADCRLKVFQVRKRLVHDELTVSFTRLTRTGFDRELRSMTSTVFGHDDEGSARVFDFKEPPSRVITVLHRLFLKRTTWGEQITIHLSCRFRDPLDTTDTEIFAPSSLEGLSNDLQKLTTDGPYSDMTLRCGDRSIPVHKAILSSRSQVLEVMLQNDMMEKSTGSLDITDMNFQVLELFLRFVYTGTLPPELTVNNVADLYEVGEKYLVGALRTKCASVLTEHLTEDNACDMLVLADTHSDTSFKESVMNYIINQEIPSSYKEWPNFFESHPELCTEVLKRYALYT